MSDALNAIAILVGIGIIVVGILLLLQLQKPAPKEEVIVRDPRYPGGRYGGWWPGRWGGRGRYPGGRWWPGYGPYYSHLPVRPLVY